MYKFVVFVRINISSTLISITRLDFYNSILGFFQAILIFDREFDYFMCDYLLTISWDVTAVYLI